MVLFRKKQPTPQQPIPDEESDQPEAQQPEQQSETATPRKLPIGKVIATILVIAIIAIPLGIFFSLPGDTSDKIEKGKDTIAKITGKQEIPDIPVECVDYLYDFSNQSQMNKVKTSDYTEISVKNEKLIVRAENKDETATIYLALDNKFQKRKAIKIQAIARINGLNNAKCGLGSVIKDSILRRTVFNGKEIDFFPDGENFNFPDNRAENGEYEIAFARIISNDNKTAKLRALVNPSFGEKYEEISSPYDLFLEKNLSNIGIDFYSDNRESQLEISEIRIYASEN